MRNQFFVSYWTRVGWVSGLVTIASQSNLEKVTTIPIDQLRRKHLSHKYHHYPPFWWSKFQVVIVCRILDKKAVNIEANWELLLFSYVHCAHCFILLWPLVILTTKMAGNDIHDKGSRRNWSIPCIWKLLHDTYPHTSLRNQIGWGHVICLTQTSDWLKSCD